MSTARRPAPTTLAFHSSRIVVDVGVLIVMAAMSLPFVNAPSGERSAVLLDALPTVLLLAPIFGITLVPDHTRPIPRILGWFSLVLGLAAFPYSIAKYADASLTADTLGGSVGTGAALLVFGSFVTLVGIGIGLARSFIGLESGGYPGRRRAVSTRRQRHNSAPPKDTISEGSPFAPDAAGALDSSPDDPAAAPGAPEPARRPGHPQPRPRTARPMADENPFGSPLFDSLEIPAIVDADKQASLTFEAEDASERTADDED